MGMGPENRKYDEKAKWLYEMHRETHPTWPPFAFLKRKERDYWRGLAEIMIKDDLYAGA